jgi:hypothetical protein
MHERYDKLRDKSIIEGFAAVHRETGRIVSDQATVGRSARRP